MVKKAKNRTSDHSRCNGAISIIGIGPGGLEHLTGKAKDALKGCDAVVGYKTYIDLIQDIICGKEIVSTGMTQEVERCQKAIELAQEGKKVAIVSSGDSGIYGMAGLVLELMGGTRWETGSGKRKKEFATPHIPHPASRIPVSIVPGVPAFCAAASLLGAPLMHDFASISLSDLLTPWQKIKERITKASEADFVIILYNPKSKSRVSQLKEAIDLVSRYRDKNTPVGIVKNAARTGEEVRIITLKKLPDHYDFIDMSTVLIMGNSKTFVSNNRMITPRGYDV